MRPVHTLVAVVAATLCGTLLVVPPASASPGAAPAGEIIPLAPADGSVPAGFDSWEAVAAYQVQLNNAARTLMSAGEALPRSGYAGVVASPQKRSVQLFWKGTLPDRMQQVIRRAGSSVTVHVYRARHSAAELRAAADRLMTSTDPAASPITAIEPRFDGSGLRVSSTRDISSATVAALTGATVTTEVVRVATAPTATSRHDDSEQYYGGSRWGRANTSAHCTTGFGVNYAGLTRMLTAGHCMAQGDWAYDGGNDYMGGFIRRYNGLDSGIIDVRSAGRMFDGGNFSNFSKPVAGQTSAIPGNHVCSSGAFSGVICSLVVQTWTTSFNLSGVGWVSGAQKVYRSDGPAWGVGDSGGPIFTLSADPNRVLAVGIMSAGTDSVTWCQGDGGRNCYKGGWYVRIQNVLSHWGATLRTA